jgi:hypothetical protein
MEYHTRDQKRVKEPYERLTDICRSLGPHFSTDNFATLQRRELSAHESVSKKTPQPTSSGSFSRRSRPMSEAMGALNIFRLASEL